jgi:hypothetical protein
VYSELHNPEHDLQREKSKASVTISISCFAGAIVGTFRQGSILIQYREGKFTDVNMFWLCQSRSTFDAQCSLANNDPYWMCSLQDCFKKIFTIMSLS